MLQAALETRTQVIWDLCHFGVPDCVDATALDFPQRFAAFARQAAKLVRSIDERPQWWCPVNEISYWAYAAGDEAYMAPALAGRASFLKLQFAAAFLEARSAILSVDPRSKFIATDPLICISDDDGNISHLDRSQGFEAWDMLLGHSVPELEGDPSSVDVLGVNYYSNNQWRSESRVPVGMGQRGYRPLRLLLADLWERYQKPMILSETGAEGPNGDNWLAYVQSEVQHARSSGIPVLGICIYPVMDYPGWVNGRHCQCGLVELKDNLTTRVLRAAPSIAGSAEHSDSEMF